MASQYPDVSFIIPHLGSFNDDWRAQQQVVDQLVRWPNVYADTSGVRRFDYLVQATRRAGPNKLLFGTDGPWPEERVRLYWRFLETDDEYFPYSERPVPPQGFWNIYGVHLPDDVLRKVYHENARRIIPGVGERLERYQPRQPSLPRP